MPLTRSRSARLFANNIDSSSSSSSSSSSDDDDEPPKQPLPPPAAAVFVHPYQRHAHDMLPLLERARALLQEIVRLEHQAHESTPGVSFSPSIVSFEAMEMGLGYAVDHARAALVNREAAWYMGGRRR